MAETSLEERLAALEAEVAQIKQRLERQPEPEAEQHVAPWWQQRFGAFKDDPLYDEATRLGREYRESLRPKDDPES